MNTYYRPFYEQAKNLQNQYHDLVGDPSHPTSHILAHEIHQLTQDIHASKHPRDVENRIRVIQRQLIEARAQGSRVLSEGHNQYLHHNYEHMRNGLRQLPHY